MRRSPAPLPRCSQIVTASLASCAGDHAPGRRCLPTLLLVCCARGAATGRRAVRSGVRCRSWRGCMRRPKTRMRTTQTPRRRVWVAGQRACPHVAAGVLWRVRDAWDRPPFRVLPVDMNGSVERLHRCTIRSTQYCMLLLAPLLRALTPPGCAGGAPGGVSEVALRSQTRQRTELQRI